MSRFKNYITLFAAMVKILFPAEQKETLAGVISIVAVKRNLINIHIRSTINWKHTYLSAKVAAIPSKIVACGKNPYQNEKNCFWNKSKIVVAYTDWCVEKSDHAAVVCKLKVENNIVKGRGIIRINADLLDSPEIANEVREHVKMLKDQIPVDWDPPSKLEYTKVAIRSGISLATGRKEGWRLLI